MIDGYEQLSKGDECVVMISGGALQFLEKYGKSKNKDVRKAIQILGKLAKFGRDGVDNTEQFRREGRFPSGAKGGVPVAVYAVKAFQLRLYGGFVTATGNRYFLVVEAAEKKKHRADQKLLARVGKELGACDG